MIQLRTNNNYGLFKSTCDTKSIVIRRPTLRNVTRWSSTYLMLKQYVDIHQILYSNEEFNSLNFNLLSGIELQLLKLYLAVLEQLNDITKANLYNKTRWYCPRQECMLMWLLIIIQIIYVLIFWNIKKVPTRHHLKQVLSKLTKVNNSILPK